MFDLVTKNQKPKRAHMRGILLPKTCEHTVMPTAYYHTSTAHVLTIAKELAREETARGNDVFLVAKRVDAHIVLYVLSKKNWTNIIDTILDFPNRTLFCISTSDSVSEARVVESFSGDGIVMTLGFLKCQTHYDLAKRGCPQVPTQAKRARLE